MFDIGLVELVILAFWAYCIFDVIRTPDGTTENLPKMIWLLIVIFLGFPMPIGTLAWMLLGRPRNASFNLRAHTTRETYTPPLPPSPPPPVRDDDYQRKREDAIRRYNEEKEEELRKREADLLRREEELRKREQGSE